MLDSIYRFVSTLIDVILRIIYLPFAVLAWVLSLLPNIRTIIIALIIAFAMYFVARYGSDAIDNGLYIMNRVAAPYYQEEWKPILEGIIRQFFNRFICWFNAILWFPYGYGKDVVFPVMREGGWGTMVTNFALFLKQVSLDVFLGYIMNGRFFTEELDFSAICVAWQTFWRSWQALICYGCNDLCPYFTKLPIIPMIFTSDQYADQAFWDFVAQTINGWFVFSQQVMYIVRDVLFPVGGSRVTLRTDFRRAFDLWVMATVNFWRSFENILNAFWVEFIPFQFDWTDVLQFFGIVWIMLLRTIQLILDIALNSDQVLTHFSNTDSTYWIQSVKEDYKTIIGLLAVASYFDDIPLLTAKRMPSSIITNYELRPTQASLPNGLPNPLFNQILGSSYSCILLERVFCDPANQGITCAQKFQGTLLEEVDICCPVNTLLGVTTDFMAFLFEFSLHLKDANDFMRYVDKQPFTTQFKQRTVDFLGCAFQFFRIVKSYGFCIERILFELTNFVVCTAELLYRVLVAVITLPYYERFMPGETNFISTGGGNAPVKMATEFLDRIADETTADGLVNCLCTLMNTGFRVSFAGCNASSCIPTGYIDPDPPSKRHMMRMSTEEYREHRKYRIRGYFGSSFYNLTTKTRYYSQELTPIMTYGKGQHGSIQFPTSWDTVYDAVPVLLDSMTMMGRNFDQVFGQWKKQKCNKPIPGQIGVCNHPDVVFERIMNTDDLEWNPFRYEGVYVPHVGHHKRLVTTAPMEQVNCTANPNNSPCFNICCLPVKIIQLLAHIVAFTVRAMNEFIQSRTAQGSRYYDGLSCSIDNEPCLESDLIMLVVKIIDPLECICQFVKLLIPNRGGFQDPCCAFTVAGEMASCIIQILINVVNSINGGAPEYTYLKANDPSMPGNVVSDFNLVLRIGLVLFDCACDFIRAIFSIALTNSQDLVNSFDPCCILRVFVKAGLAAAKLLFRLLISMTTMDQENSQCYMYIQTPGNENRTNCPIGIPKLPIMQDFAEITVALFATPSERQTRECGVLRESENPDDFGAATCYCRAINSLLTMVFKFIVPPNSDPMGLPTHNQTNDAGTQNTCVIDLCCPVYRISQILKGAVDFLGQFTWSFIQNWEDKEVNVGGIIEYYYLPQETFEFFFCDEYGPENYYVDGNINTFSLENQGQLDADIEFTTEAIDDVYSLNSNPYGIEGDGGFAGAGGSYTNNLLLDEYIIPNFDGGSFATGVPSLTQNRPLDSPGVYMPVNLATDGIVNTGAELSDRERARIKCGRLEPVIIGTYNLLARCLCPGCHTLRNDAKGIGNAADKILRFTLAFVTGESPLFPVQLVWPHCLCCGGPEYDQTGMAVPFASAFSVALRQILILSRNIANPSYWTVAGTNLAGGTEKAGSKLADNLEDIKKTWINRFLAPFADALCRFLTNSACLLSLLIGDTCAEGMDGALGNDYDVRYQVISSVFRYIAEAFIRFIAVIEAMIKLVTQELPGQCIGSPKVTQGNADTPENQGSDGGSVVPTCSQKASGFKGPDYPKGTNNPISARNIGRILVSILTFIFDALIGVGALGCTQVCPGLQFATDEQNVMVQATCNCYNLSPYVGIVSSRCSYRECDKFFNGLPNGDFRDTDNDPDAFSCASTTAMAFKDGYRCTADGALVEHTGLVAGTNNPVQTYEDFRVTDNRCNEGCANDTETTRRDIIYTTVGNAAWEITYGEANRWFPVIEKGTLLCKTNAAPSLVALAGELFGSNNIIFPSVGPAFGQDPRCVCYPVGTYPLSNEYGVDFPAAPVGTIGCGLPYGPGTGIEERDATQSVCPNSGNVYPLPIPNLPPIVAATADRCNNCLSIALLGGGSTCAGIDPPLSPGFEWLHGPSGPRTSGGIGSMDCPVGQYYMQSGCVYVCTHPQRGIIIGETNLTVADEQCRNCNALVLNLPVSGVPSPPNTQPVCDRKFCISKGWCKNDQLVPCARGYGQPVLDGVGIIVLKYARCLLRNLFNNLGIPGFGDFVGGILTVVLHILSIIWQLSGGIIRFAVAILVWGMQIAQGISTGILDAYKVAQGLGDVVNAFIGIFTQPVVLSAGPGKRDVATSPCESIDDIYQRMLCLCNHANITNCGNVVDDLWKHMNSEPGKSLRKVFERQSPRYNNEAAFRNFQKSLENFLDYPEAHKCIQTDNAQGCFCRAVDTHGFCRWDKEARQTIPKDIELTEMITQISYIFNDDTSCSMIWIHLNDFFTDSGKVTKWNDIPYARRVEAVDCLTKRSRGESWKKSYESFPESYFYDTRGVSRWIGNIVDGMMISAKDMARRQDERVRNVLHRLNTTHSFEERFNMTHTQYLERLNRRSRILKALLIKKYGFTQHSVMLEPMMHLDSYHFRYRSGYWGHLMGRAYNLWANGDLSLMIGGNVTELLKETQESYYEVQNSVSMINRHFSAINDEIKTMYHGLMSPTKSINPDPKKYEYPEFPFTFNRTRMHEIMPVLDTPGFRWGPGFELEDIKWLPDIRWTERITYNWHALKRMVYSGVHVIWPEYTQKHTHERFIIAGNCRLMDGFISLGTEVMDYCIAEFQENTPENRSMFTRYWKETRAYRPEVISNRTHKWEGSDWKRPRLIQQQKKTKRVMFDRRVYKRTLISSSAQRFNLYDQIITWVEEIFNIDLRQLRDGFFSDLSEWVRNTNTDPKDYPNVGALYWVSFSLKCEFPENLNCSIGIGLREALKVVSFWYAVIVLVSALVFPSVVNLLSFIFSITGYIVVLAGVAWHYSFGCAIMFPSTAIWPFAVTVPIFPFPVNILPALPECLWDEFVSILADIFATTYTWIPASLFNGADGTGFVNCYELGISDGIQNVLFLGYYYLGNWFVELLIGITSTTIARIIPGIDVYMRDTLNSFRAASPTQQDRQLFCAWFTLPAVVLPALIIWLIASFALIIVPALLAVFTALIQFIPTLPFYDAIVGPGNAQGFNTLEGEGDGDYPTRLDEKEEEEEEEEAYYRPPTLVKAPIGWTDKAARWVEKRFMPHRKTE